MVWLKDNKPMDDRLADRMTTTLDGDTYKLEIENVLESDSGIYTAHASNGDGQATCTAQLVVQECNYIYCFIYFFSSNIIKQAYCSS